MSKGVQSLEEFVKARTMYSGWGQVGKYYWETRDWDIAEIAKVIRKQIKQDSNGEVLPKELKTKVKIKRYAGGQSLDILVLKESVPKLFDWSYRVRARLQYLLTSYNYDFSSVQNDYHDTRYHHDIRFLEVF